MKYPELIYTVARQISLRLANTSRKACDLAFLGVKERIASALVDLCHEPDAQKKKMHPYSNYPLRISQAGWLLERNGSENTKRFTVQTPYNAVR